VCDTCDALWTHQTAIGPATWVPADLFLKARGVVAGRAALSPVDPLAALRDAVAADPDDVAARNGLARRLFEAGRSQESLEQYAAILQRRPADLEALQGAANAAVGIGDGERAEGYFRLLAALGGSRVEPRGTSGQQEEREGEAFEAEQLRVAAEADVQAAADADADAAQDAQGWADERPTVRLDDVGGMEPVKRRLQTAFLGPLRNPELRKLYGASLRGGLLLFGPPGCGKTFIARATAGELGARFMSIGLSDVLDMWLGQSERQLRALFERARRLAPVVVFFDEIDALGQKRTQLRHSAGRNVVNQLLAELDGADRDNAGVFVLGATNHPWDVDTALLRPGRFDRRLLVLPPDAPARETILGFHLRERPTRDLDLGWLAGHTDGYSGADLAHLCDSAAELAIEASLSDGHPRPIDMRFMRQALKDVRPSIAAWFETARNYALFGNDDGVYDELVAYMREHRLL
jgi:SpoVK/Ycf46/Vps4 family AAA+-type ATPase